METLATELGFQICKDLQDKRARFYLVADTSMQIDYIFFLLSASPIGIGGHT